MAMDLNLKGRIALVTGSTGGIGYATARELARLGAAVAINGRSRKRVDQAIAKLKGEVPAGEFVPAPGDLATADGTASVIAAIPAADILVNNAGIFEPKPFFEIPDADWMKFFEVNVLSGIRLARHYTPLMVGKGWGRVVFISSESALQIPAEMVHYGMTKTAQLAVARGLAET
jgi:NAD(P)-dependent dehydrogenase (short-subunit alcohol dehydrogenase family)